MELFDPARLFSGSRAEKPGNLVRHWSRCPISADAHEHKLSLGHQCVVRITPGCLMHRKTGPPETGVVSVEPQPITGKRACEIFYRCLPNRRPSVAAIENVDTGPFSHSLPTRVFEQAKKGGLVHVPKRITVVWID